MKSPLPTSFVLLLATVLLVSLLVVFVKVGREFFGGLLSANMFRVGADGTLLAALLYSLAGLLAGIMYRQNRRWLNHIGVIGSGLLFVGLLTLTGYIVWGVWQAMQGR